MCLLVQFLEVLYWVICEEVIGWGVFLEIMISDVVECVVWVRRWV